MKSYRTGFTGHLGLLLLCASPHLWADSSSEEMVVTPSRTAEPLQTSLGQTTVITAAQIAQDPSADLGQLLSGYANVDVVRSGGPGAQTSIFMRGANSNQTLVMVNGVPINNGTLGLADIQYWLNTQDIDHIEVVRGAHASLYGSGALGGVINIITRQPHDNSTEVSGAWGSEKTYQSNLRQNFSSSNLHGSLSVGNNNTQGYPMFYPASSNGYPPTSGNFDRHGSTELGWTGNSWDVEASYQENRGRNQFMDTFSTPPIPNVLDFENRTGILQLQGQLTSDWNTRLLTSRTTDLSNQRPDTNSPYTQIFESAENRVDWQNTFNLPGRQQLIAGSTYTDQSNQFTGVTTTPLLLNQPLHNWAGYAEDTWHYHALEIKAAGRYEADNVWGNHQTNDFTLGYNLAKHHSLYFNRSTAFRAPATEELYYPGASNPLLKPETSVGYEAGSKNVCGPFEINMDVFRTLVSNMIISPPPNYLPYNIQNAYLRGIDVHTDLHVNNWAIGADATVGRYTDLSYHQDLPERPRRSLSLHSTYIYKNFSTQINWQSASTSQTTYIYGPPISLPGYGVINLSTTWTAASWLKITGSIDNLANHVYYLNANSTTQYYLAQPRQYMLSMNAKF